MSKSMFRIKRHFYSYLMVGLSLFSEGCSLKNGSAISSQENKIYLSIDFREYFDNDIIYIYKNGQLYNEIILTTDPIVDVADHIQVEWIDSCQLMFVLNNETDTLIYHMNNSKNLFIMIHNKSDSLYYYERNTPPIYE